MTGSGTIDDPYIIYDVNDLQAMNNDLAAYYELANDIDASATSGWTWVEDSVVCKGFQPIGQELGKFTGHFDGKGYSIFDLYIDRGATTLVPTSTGLFGFAEDCHVSNVKLVNFDITGSSMRPTGALAGRFDSADHKSYVTNCAAINCKVTGTAAPGPGSWKGGLIGYVDGAEVSGCYSTGEVTEFSSGGLIGTVIRGTISKCFSACNVTALVGSAGGFACRNDAAIENCYARGDVVGGTKAAGFVQDNTGSIDNCYSTGLVTGASAGGLVERIDGASVITDSFWDTETSGQATSAGGTGKTTAEMKTEATFTGAGWDFDTIWAINPACNDGYPCLLDVTPSCTKVPAVPFIINKAYALSREEL